ncbi:hypothetical protein PGT21_003952 [Puccinia graminis f. sp. tritici]|uniref:Uncharacterized protein n=1 Tax=Puccinia graminis f. sp. tritici TaxID=56615 RepID=A0A5B0RTV7_PUCGR|nr:hypothetical protein PGT21_003952 [Puccinia graminis f. sp. tritici]KAA1128475.1 hypothetical protein PGTUg99_013046 [Puccinia graminis f. sp. tritici]
MYESSSNAIQLGRKSLRELNSGTERQQSSLHLSQEHIRAENVVRAMSLDTYTGATQNVLGLEERYKSLLKDHLIHYLPSIGESNYFTGNWLHDVCYFTLQAVPNKTKINGMRLDQCLNPTEWKRVYQHFISMTVNHAM